jgi:hypothetical protein
MSWRRCWRLVPGDGRVATHALPTLGRFCEDLDQPPPPGLDRLAPLAQTFERLPEAALPKDLVRPVCVPTSKLA